MDKLTRAGDAAHAHKLGACTYFPEEVLKVTPRLRGPVARPSVASALYATEGKTVADVMMSWSAP